MGLPKELLGSLSKLESFDKEAFEKVHASGEQITSIRINPSKLNNPIHHSPFAIHKKIPWTASGYYLKSRPSFTFDPFFHAGCYYVQEASSMFLEQALRQTVDLSEPLKVLDLCAAPGGKSTHIQSLISKDSLLVSNEVIRPRVNILRDNIIKWGCENVLVTNNDPKDFGRMVGYFDVIVADAPCSGSGLFRRDPEAINEWSENNVQLCAQRQQRILADVWPSLKKDGVLIYSTCSYSKEEDEDIIDWMRQEFRCDNISLKIPAEWGITESNGGYRFWPDKVNGEGLFIACIQKEDGDTVYKKNKNNPVGRVSQSEKNILQNWVNDQEYLVTRLQNKVLAWPEPLTQDLLFLQLQQLRVNYSGVVLGELIRDKLVPDHALAMSRLLCEKVEKLELNYTQAIAYLQKNDFQVATETIGWKLVTYKSFGLGWINVLPGRINNYYPRELRILKRN